jgi:hypothetical protein
MGGLTDEYPYPYICVPALSSQDQFVNTLSEVDVLVNGELCGQLPTETGDYTEYTVTCDIPLNGTTVELCTTKGDHQLGLKGITVNEYHEYSRTLQEQIDDLDLEIIDYQGQVSTLGFEITTIT